MQFPGKLRNQTSENDKKRSFGPYFGPHLGPQNFFREFYFYYMLDIVASYHCIQLQGKLMNQTWENDENSNLGPDFCSFGPHLGTKSFFRGCYLY